MTSDQQLTSFGLYLQTARLEKKMSIESLSADTRIRVEVLKQLEAEDHEHLPNEVFVRGFIRSYAQAVGADAAEALERYRASRELRSIKTDRKLAPVNRPNRFWLGLTAAVGAVLLLAALTLYFYTRINAPSAVPDVTATAPVENLPAPPEKIPAVEKKTPPLPATGAPETKSLDTEPQTLAKQYMLEIRAVEETWLKIIVDDQPAREMTLQADEVRQIQAASLLNLLIGNAGGVELKFNGKPVEVTGKSGQVVNIQLP